MNPLLLAGACVAAFALLKSKEPASGGSSPPGNTSPPDPKKMTVASLEATEPIRRSGGNTSVEVVDRIVELIGIKSDKGFDYPDCDAFPATQGETISSYLFRIASWQFKNAYNMDFYKPDATPVNSDAPKTNFTACNLYYYVSGASIKIGSREWPAGTVLHHASADARLILADANVKVFLKGFYPDKEWESIYDYVIKDCVRYYISQGSNTEGRLLMFCILCAESFGILPFSGARYDFSGMKALSFCQELFPGGASWLYKQYIRYCGLVRFATFKHYAGTQEINATAAASQATRDRCKSELRQMFGCFEAADYASNPLLKALKDSVSRSAGL